MSYSTPELPLELSYDDAVNLTMHLVDFERGKHSPGHSNFHLHRMRYIANLLTGPHLKIPSIHIAGTKGKGSVAAMVASILREGNYKVGLTTSPHLHSLRERINIDGVNISENDFIAIVKFLWPYVIQVEKKSGYGQLTWFEFMVTAAFVYFYNNHVDYQVVETGLGGRLDATNILIPEMSIITSISLDHTEILGDSILEIAREKAGIIKNNIPVILAPQYYYNEVFDVVENMARSLDAPFVNVLDSYKYDIESLSIKGQIVCVSGKYFNYKFSLPLLGLYQVENAITAIASIESLIDNGINIDRFDIENGLEKVSWPGRMEILNVNNKSIVVDGAHNEFSAKNFVETLKDERIGILGEKYSNIVIIFGVLNNHDCTNILKELAILNPLLVPVKSNHPKSTEPEDIFDLAKTLDISTINYDIGLTNIANAMTYATSIFGDDTIILVTGSISVVAEALNWYEISLEGYKKL
jgi:dihydrofolate synthase/folylpolyglutamate synthase